MNILKMAEGVYKITEQFEEALCKYTGAPYCVAVDNGSNALFLALYYDDIRGKEISIPSRTYPSVPCEIIHAGGKVKFYPVPGKQITGAYRLEGSNVIDSALRFTCNMYIPGTYMCLSFTGPHKRFKLLKGGAILTDNEKAYQWFKRARFSGRREVPYMKDTFDMTGWNFYMLPEIATMGLHLMAQLYDAKGRPRKFADLTMSYPDLSNATAYK